MIIIGSDRYRDGIRVCILGNGLFRESGCIESERYFGTVNEKLEFLIVSESIKSRK